MLVAFHPPAPARSMPRWTEADSDDETCNQLLADSSERLLVPAPVVVELE